MKRLLCSLLLAVAAPAHADITNRQILPLGERESFLANSGTGDAGDTGAVYYNPAGLTALKSDKISVLGSVYLSYSTSTEALAHLDGTDVPYSASGFNSIPVTFVAAKKIAAWTLAFSALIPDSLQAENRSPVKTPSTTGTILQSYRLSDVWLGISAARPLDEESPWSFGATLFVVQHSQNNTAGILVDVPSGTNAFSLGISRVQLNTVGLTPNLGVHYRASKEINLGLRLQLPLIQIAGKADTYNALRSSAASVTPTTEDKADTQAYYQLPLDATLGAAFTPTPSVEFLTDLSFQVGTTYDSIPGSSLNNHYETGFTPRLNLGIEAKPDPTFPIRAGFFYNPSALHYLSDGGASSRENYYGLTTGFAVITQHVESGIGFFYIWAQGEVIPAGGPIDARAKLSTSAVGGLLTTAYVF